MSKVYSDRPTMSEHFIKELPGKHSTRGYRVIEVSIADSAKFYNSPKYAWDKQAESMWRSSTASEWIPRGFRSSEEAREFCKGFEVPPKLVHKARTLSRELVRELLQNNGAPRIERNLSQGRLNSGSIKRVMLDIQKSRFSAETTRPFKQRQRLSPSRPHVGICADGSWSTFWQGGDSYIPNVMSLMMGITWACEAIACPCTAAITRSIDTHFDHLKMDMGALLITSPDRHLNTANLAVGFHPELYRCGSSFDICSSYDNMRLCSQRYAASDSEIGLIKPEEAVNEGCKDGGHGVRYLKSLGATVTVAIGEVRDRNEATVYLSSNTDLETAIKKIAQVVGDGLRNKAAPVSATTPHPPSESFFTSIYTGPFTSMNQYLIK